MENNKCDDCGVNDIPAYRKKYCDDCANRRKAEYEDAKGLPLQASGEPNPAYTESEKLVDKPVSREKSIVAQCLTKCVAEITTVQDGITSKQIMESVLETYNFFLKEL